MVHATKNLEYHGYTIARLVGLLEPERRSASNALLAAHHEAKRGLPPWSPTSLEDPLQRWIRRALRALRQRNGHVHGILLWRRTRGAEWRTTLHSMRDGEPYATTVPRPYEPLKELDNLTVTTKALDSEALDLITGLRVPLGQDRSVSHPALTGRRTMPSDEYVRDWFTTIGYDKVPPAWVSWPRERYEAQIRREALRNAPVLLVDPATAPHVQIE